MAEVPGSDSDDSESSSLMTNQRNVKLTIASSVSVTDDQGRILPDVFKALRGEIPHSEWIEIGEIVREVNYKTIAGDEDPLDVHLNQEDPIDLSLENIGIFLEFHTSKKGDPERVDELKRRIFIHGVTRETEKVKEEYMALLQLMKFALYIDDKPLSYALHKICFEGLRSMDDENDRILTPMVNDFMSNELSDETVRRRGEAKSQREAEILNEVIRRREAGMPPRASAAQPAAEMSQPAPSRDTGRVSPSVLSSSHDSVDLPSSIGSAQPAGAISSPGQQGPVAASSPNTRSPASRSFGDTSAIAPLSTQGSRSTEQMPNSPRPTRNSSDIYTSRYSLTPPTMPPPSSPQSSPRQPWISSSSEADSNSRDDSIRFASADEGWSYVNSSADASSLEVEDSENASARSELVSDQNRSSISMIRLQPNTSVSTNVSQPGAQNSPAGASGISDGRYSKTPSFSRSSTSQPSAQNSPAGASGISDGRYSKTPSFSRSSTSQPSAQKSGASDMDSMEGSLATSRESVRSGRRLQSDGPQSAAYTETDPMTADSPRVAIQTRRSQSSSSSSSASSDKSAKTATSKVPSENNPSPTPSSEQPTDEQASFNYQNQPPTPSGFQHDGFTPTWQEFAKMVKLDERKISGDQTMEGDAAFGAEKYEFKPSQSLDDEEEDTGHEEESKKRPRSNGSIGRPTPPKKQNMGMRYETAMSAAKTVVSSDVVKRAKDTAKKFAKDEIRRVVSSAVMGKRQIEPTQNLSDFSRGTLLALVEKKKGDFEQEKEKLKDSIKRWVAHRENVRLGAKGVSFKEGKDLDDEQNAARERMRLIRTVIKNVEEALETQSKSPKTMGARTVRPGGGKSFLSGDDDEPVAKMQQTASIGSSFQSSPKTNTSQAAPATISQPTNASVPVDLGVDLREIDDEYLLQLSHDAVGFFDEIGAFGQDQMQGVVNDQNQDDDDDDDDDDKGVEDSLFERSYNRISAEQDARAAFYNRERGFASDSAAPAPRTGKSQFRDMSYISPIDRDAIGHIMSDLQADTSTPIRKQKPGMPSSVNIYSGSKDPEVVYFCGLPGSFERRNAIVKFISRQDMEVNSLLQHGEYSQMKSDPDINLMMADINKSPFTLLSLTEQYKKDLYAFYSGVSLRTREICTKHINLLNVICELMSAFFHITRESYIAAHTEGAAKFVLNRLSDSVIGMIHRRIRVIRELVAEAIACFQVAKASFTGMNATSVYIASNNCLTDFDMTYRGLYKVALCLDTYRISAEHVITGVSSYYADDALKTAKTAQRALFDALEDLRGDAFSLKRRFAEVGADIGTQMKLCDSYQKTVKMIGYDHGWSLDAMSSILTSTQQRAGEVKTNAENLCESESRFAGEETQLMLACINGSQDGEFEERDFRRSIKRVLDRLTADANLLTAAKENAEKAERIRKTVYTGQLAGVSRTLPNTVRTHFNYIALYEIAETRFTATLDKASSLFMAYSDTLLKKLAVARATKDADAEQLIIGTIKEITVVFDTIDTHYTQLVAAQEQTMPLAFPNGMPKSERALSIRMDSQKKDYAKLAAIQSQNPSFRQQAEANRVSSLSSAPKIPTQFDAPITQIVPVVPPLEFQEVFSFSQRSRAPAAAAAAADIYIPPSLLPPPPPLSQLPLPSELGSSDIIVMDDLDLDNIQIQSPFN